MEDAMNAKEAAAVYWSTLDAVTDAKPTIAKHDAACKVLKEHMGEKKLATYQGIALRETSGGQRLDQGKAVAKFGDKLKDCFVDTVRRSLIPVKRPKSLEPAA
jgi:hypothetical protein